MTDLIARTPTVIAKVQDSIPGDFPAELSDSILSGVEAAAQRLAAG